jgi:hypothetical protein
VGLRQKRERVRRFSSIEGRGVDGNFIAVPSRNSTESQLGNSTENNEKALEIGIGGRNGNEAQLNRN